MYMYSIAILTWNTLFWNASGFPASSIAIRIFFNSTISSYVVISSKKKNSSIRLDIFGIVANHSHGIYTAAW